MPEVPEGKGTCNSKRLKVKKTREWGIEKAGHLGAWTSGIVENEKSRQCHMQIRKLREGSDPFKIPHLELGLKLKSVVCGLTFLYYMHHSR